jgi:hypothetical protein
MVGGRKLALIAALLAGAAVLTWTVVETLRDGPDENSATEAASTSPIARMVARMGPPTRAQGVAAGYYAGDAGWDGWARAAADLRASGDLTGDSDGELGYLRGRSFWDADQDLDGARGRRLSMKDPAADRARRGREGSIQARSYRVPRSGRPTILTSGRRIGEPHIRMPHDAAVSLGIDARGQMPVRLEVCVDRAGKPDEVRVIESTGEEAVDNYVARQMLAGRYRPLQHEGRKVAFCERATVIVEL